MTREMITYYAQRAAEYERIYDKDTWQDDLDWIRTRLPGFFAGRRVFEAACGTGYWTRYAAERARSVHATDINSDTLALARTKTYAAPVTFEKRDAYAPAAGPARHDAGLAAFWLSHVDLARMAEFLRAFHGRLEPGAAVVMFDERDYEDRRTAASRWDEAGNRYEMRRLASGAHFEIVKNFFPEADLARRLAGHATDLEYRELRCLWILEYRVG
jgi:demethylmenaquinone methyltransferase/2-methoxy-6-polyprenyl-1,4-benzoquinol methylase